MAYEKLSAEYGEARTTTTVVVPTDLYQALRVKLVIWNKSFNLWVTERLAESLEDEIDYVDVVEEDDEGEKSEG